MSGKMSFELGITENGLIWAWIAAGVIAPLRIANHVARTDLF